LRQRIEALDDAIDAVERSGDPDSPFQQRIAVLNGALDAIEREIALATPLEPRDVPALSPSPVTALEVVLEPAPRVSFSIGGERFVYEEEIDWAERGTQVVRGDLVGIAGDGSRLIPASIAGELREDLATHLERSLFAFATDLRDRAVEGDPMPAEVTLAALATPSKTCGDWELWGGVSLRCLEHETRLRELNAERTRLLTERGTEIEERQRQLEELPIQIRRRNQAIAELIAIEKEG
jgi:hypothetical protein